MLYHLWDAGFTNLNGFDIDKSAIMVAQEIAGKCQMNIKFWVDDAANCGNVQNYDVIVWVNGMYHVDDYSLDDFFETFSKHVNAKGYLIFDMVDISYNNVPLNQYSTQDWSKENNRRPSEYKLRLCKQEVIETGKRYNAQIIKDYFINDTIPRAVYVFQMI